MRWRGLVWLALAALGAGALLLLERGAEAELPPVIDLNIAAADLTVYGAYAQDYSGIAVAAGDINGDGTGDLIIGADCADPAGDCSGETYVIYGSSSLPPTIDLSSTNADLTVYGEDYQDRSGRAVGAGDINGDAIDDLIIGAFRADPVGGQLAGKTYVIYGSPSLPPTIDLSSASADLTVYGDDADDHSGIAVAPGDVNGDGTDDLIIGASGADPVGGQLAGETYVIYGSPSLPSTIDLDSTTADLTVYGDDANDWSGYRVAAGDINGDGTDDLVIAAQFADPAGRTEAGETYVIYGSPSLPSTIDLDSTTADLTVSGEDYQGHFGEAVGAGDIDGDGTDDLIIGAPLADPAGRTEAGETYVIYGSPSLPSTIDLDSTTADLTVYGDDANDWCGYRVAAGDINGDGTEDLIIGAPFSDPLWRGDAGKTYGVYGGASLPASIDLNGTSADVTVYGDDANDLSGRAVAAGDINNDGTDDLIIGAPTADPAGGGDAGETYVIYGEQLGMPVGGIAEYPDVATSSGPSSTDYALWAAVAASSSMALAAGACYARRRWLT